MWRSDHGIQDYSWITEGAEGCAHGSASGGPARGNSGHMRHFQVPQRSWNTRHVHPAFLVRHGNHLPVWSPGNQSQVTRFSPHCKIFYALIFGAYIYDHSTFTHNIFSSFSLLWFSLQWLLGFFSFWFPGAEMSARGKYLPWHIFFGMAIFLMAICTAETGLVQEFIFLGLVHGKEALVVNFIGVAILLFGLVVAFSALLPRYRW